VVAAHGARALGKILGRRGFVYVAGTCAFLVLTGGAVLRVVEPETVASYRDGLWWAIVTTTTVGYGDIFPVSPVGRIAGTVLML
jgi:voltage-gated potassium channel